MSRKEPNRNVYVGHRYVPLILEEWDKKFEYEGLSVVTHQGGSYTSKKRVPVGIDILNKEYWSLTGNYNAQVDYYREETERVSNKLDSKSDITYVDTELDKKANKTYVDTELDKKSNKTYVDNELDKKSDQTYVDTELGKKANKTYVDTELDKKSDITYVDTELGKKSNKTYVDTELGKKSDKTYVDTELGKKSDKTYVDNEISDIQNTVSGIAHVLNVNSPENIGIDFNTKYNELSDGDKLLIPPGKYETSETIILDKGINVDFTGVEIVYTGNTTALIIGDPATEFHGLEITLPFIYNYELNWGKDTTGVHIYNIYTSNFYNIEIEDFKKGLVVDARNNIGNTYNSFYFKRMVDNEKSLTLTSSAKGWSNDNRFYGGRFGWTSAVRPYMSNKNMHVFFEYIDYSQNNNRFYGCSFESGANMGVEYAVYAEDGRMNYFRECRYELVKKIHLEKGLDFQFTDGFGLETVEFTGVDPSVIKSNQKNFEKRWDPLQLSNGRGVLNNALEILKPNHDKALEIVASGEVSSIDRGNFTKGIQWYGSFNNTISYRGLYHGSGSPEGVLKANPGSMYLNVSGGDSNTLYIKESGVNTETGWENYSRSEARPYVSYTPNFIGEIAVVQEGSQEGIYIATGTESNNDWKKLSIAE